MSHDHPQPAHETPVPEAKPETTRQMSFRVLEDGTISAEFGPGLDPLTLNPAEVPESIIAAAVAEGLISRSRGYTSKLTAENRTPEKLREQIAKAFSNILAGVWKIEREAGAGEISQEVEAAFRFRASRAKSKGVEFTDTIEMVSEAFSKLTDAQKKELKALPRYQAALAEVKAEHAAKRAKKLAEAADKAEENVEF